MKMSEIKNFVVLTEEVECPGANREFRTLIPTEPVEGFPVLQGTMGQISEAFVKMGFKSYWESGRPYGGRNDCWIIIQPLSAAI